MRRWLAGLLRWLVWRLHDDDHREVVSIVDEYDILRCQIEVMGDGRHGVDAIFVCLPVGWDCTVVGSNDFIRRSNTR